MQEGSWFRFDPLRALWDRAGRKAAAIKESGSKAAATADLHLRGRKLTMVELGMIRWVFGKVPGVERARIYPFNFWWPYRNNRAMIPNGNIYFPHQDFRDDYSVPTVSVQLRALFMHEATHLYQHYRLGMWVALRGIVDRRYEYELDGRQLPKYRL